MTETGQEIKVVEANEANIVGQKNDEERQQQPPAVAAAEATFDFRARLDGPSNMAELSTMMQERNIANSDDLQFDEEFVDQFYNDADHTPGVECMFNGEPCVWGETMWTMIHLLTYYYPAEPSDNVKRAAYQQIHAYRYTLPCENCRRGFRKELLETPVEEFLESRETFIEWGIEIHTSVNKRLGQPDFDTDATFKRILARENAKKNKKDATANHSGGKDSNKALSSAKSTAKRGKQSVAAQTRGAVGGDVATTTSRKHVQNAAVASNAATTSATSQISKRKTTNYGVQNRHVSAQQSLQSVRDALRRTNVLSLQQRANMLRNQRSKEARRVKEPAECKSCGNSKKPIQPSAF